ncbi:MAG TPA: hypothetical protein VGH38_11170 [Bryobacteraceae bacterium]
MKKSARITLTVVATVGLAACGRRHPDPCVAGTFNQQACQEAIDRGGYYWQGSWYPMTYHYPYPYYFDSYRGYVSRGGRVVSEPTTSYAHSAAGTGQSHGSSSSGVTRGGFGSTGAGHGAGE